MNHAYVKDVDDVRVNIIKDIIIMDNIKYNGINNASKYLIRDNSWQKKSCKML